MKLLDMLIPTVSDKVKVDSLWNVMGVGIAAINGILLLLVISKIYDSSILGLFNIIYAIFILMSQLSGGGIHFSILKHIAQFAGERKKTSVILNAGLVLTFVESSIIIVLVYTFRELLVIFFDNPLGVDAVVLILPALLFFPLNKVIMAFHNAERRMKSFAVFYGLRPLLMTSSLLVLIGFKVNAYAIVSLFSISEGILFLVLMIYSFRFLTLTVPSEFPSWIKKHFVFGLKAMVGSFFVDINTRVDILLLGIFTTDQRVGIYSFAVMIIEGFNQIPLVLGRIINPVITGYHYNKSSNELQLLIRRARVLSYKLLIPLGLLVIPLYPLIVNGLSLNSHYLNGWLPFVLLMAGTLVGIGYAPFLMILNQTGFPGGQSLLFVMIFFTNFLLNLILIPLFGIIGAAVATGISFIGTAFYIKLFVLKTLNIKI